MHSTKETRKPASTFISWEKVLCLPHCCAHSLWKRLYSRRVSGMAAKAISSQTSTMTRLPVE